MKFKELVRKPCIIGVVGDVNQGKSMLLYNILEELATDSHYDLYYYGLRLDFNKVSSKRIYSVAELEDVRNSLIVVDELSSLFDLDNRKVKKIIENTLRLINHNNNVLVLCGLPENFKKFISAKLKAVIFKKCTLRDFINGSNAKNIISSYNGYERGSEILNLSLDEALLYDGRHYHKMTVSYIKEYDSKKTNENIFKNKISTKTRTKNEQKEEQQ